MGIEPMPICSRFAGGASRNATWAGLVPVELCGEVGIGQVDILPGSALASAGPERGGPLGVHDEGPGDPLLVDILRVCLGGQRDLAERPETARERGQRAQAAGAEPAGAVDLPLLNAVLAHPAASLLHLVGVQVDAEHHRRVFGALRPAGLRRHRPADAVAVTVVRDEPDRLGLHAVRVNIQRPIARLFVELGGPGELALVRERRP